MKLKRLNPQGQLLKRNDLLQDIMILGVQVNISAQTILAYMSKIDFSIEEMQKVKVKQIGSKDKLIYFWWMAGLIATKREEALWVVGGINTLSSIIKNTLNFQAKE